MAIKYQNIINAIETKMKTILVSNGFYSNLGQRVYINKSNSLIKSSDENAINLIDVSAGVLTAKSGGIINYFDYALLIETNLHFKGGTAATDIRKGLTDVLKLIGENYNWDGLAINSYPPENQDFFQLVFDHEENIIVGAKIYFIVEYRTVQWQEE